MNGKRIITIGRECGSGGRVIGKLLAEKLGVNCYDKELLALAAKQSGYSEAIFEKLDEKPTNSFLYSLVMDTYSLSYAGSSYLDMPLNHKVFLAQFDTIKKLASEESCVIVGRCADYALEGDPDVTSVFIYGDSEAKVKDLMERYQSNDEAKTRDIMIKTDKKRASYYNYYTNGKWGEAKNYDLCINSSVLGKEGTVRLILEYLKIKESGR